jgi:hypothetical protein
MRSLVSLAAVIALAGGISIGAQSAQAVSFGFEVLEDNSPIDLSGQLFVDVLDAGGGQVSFEFQNLGPLASSISGIYFHDMNGDIDPPLVIADQSAGVSFSLGASPPDLPGGENADPPFVTTTGLLMDADSQGGKSNNGINPGEWLLVLADAFTDFNSIIAALISGDLRIGLHVIALSDGQSETYITNPTPIPLPAGLLLFLSGLAGVGFLGRYKARRRETAAA